MKALRTIAILVLGAGLPAPADVQAGAVADSSDGALEWTAAEAAGARDETPDRGATPSSDRGSRWWGIAVFGGASFLELRGDLEEPRLAGTNLLDAERAEFGLVGLQLMATFRPNVAFQTEVQWGRRREGGYIYAPFTNTSGGSQPFSIQLEQVRLNASIVASPPIYGSIRAKVLMGAAIPIREWMTVALGEPPRCHTTPNCGPRPPFVESDSASFRGRAGWSAILGGGVEWGIWNTGITLSSEVRLVLDAADPFPAREDEVAAAFSSFTARALPLDGRFGGYEAVLGIGF